MEKELMKKDCLQVDSFPWGSLTWYARDSMGHSELTLGLCRIEPGKANPRHTHPNCDEILHVLSGKILHTCGGEEAAMEEGDTITIKKGVPHNAKNIGDSVCVLGIAFTSGNRQTVAE